MLSLLLLAEIVVGSTSPRPPQAEQAHATVRIRHAAAATSAQWKAAPPAQRREIVRKTEDGRTELLRVIDYP
jgi:acyl-CoA reductase-like NAD-dependent aldehyde dehydrogenase